MSIKKFMDVDVGAQFKIGDINYTKIQDERISCCKVNNAVKSDDPNSKIQVLPITEVEVDD